MKTKEFIEKVEELGYSVEKFDINDGMEIQGENKLAGYVSGRVSHFFSIYKSDKQLAELIIEYGTTHLEEREEEKKYRYKFKPSIKTGGGGENKVFHLARYRGLLDLKLDASGISYAKSSEAFHFTDKQVEEFTDEQKLLIQLCEKIEVTSND